MKLGAKLILVASIPAILASLGLGDFFALKQSEALQASFERRGETIARALSEQLSANLAQSGDLQRGVGSLLAPLWEEEGLLSVEVLGLDGERAAFREFHAAPEVKQPFVCKRPILAPPLPGEVIRDSAGLIVVSLDPRPVEEERAAAYLAAISVAALVGLGAALLATLLGRLISRPVRQLSQAAKQIAGGEYSVEVSPRGSDELAALSHSFNQMARAITERDNSLRQSRDALRTQANELAKLAQSLQEALKARDILEATKEALSDMIVHDLKSPLAAITSAAQLLLDTVSQDDRPFVEGMLSRTRALLGMIQDLLTIRKMEEAGIPLLPAKLDALELARDVVKDLTPVAREVGATIEVEGTPSALRADRQLLSRVLENLLSNALKYHRPPKPIRVRVKPRPDGAQVEVLDNGRGIPEKYHKSIFERFHQVQSLGATERQGTGLGLTFCRMAVEAHGGKIWVESKDGEGACFSMWVPHLTKESSAPTKQVEAAE